MKKYILLALLTSILLSVQAVQTMAQTKFSVSGSLQDPAGETITGATVVLLTPDSIFYKFSASKADGQFEIKKVKTGSYILQVTFIGYKMHQQSLEVGADVNTGKITLQTQTETLGEITVESETTPVIISSDTIAYNANAFKTQPGAVAEDLLKQLPGVEVERDGTVKAQGEEVQKVVVDGKEFFGNDPQVATKNLPADAIDRVEVYDEMSDMSEFTGVDDGQRTKTINLTLKKDSKKGYFGNIEGGYGTENRFKFRTNVNRFTPKTQTSFIGMVNNINEQGFSIRDYVEFMGGFQNMRGGFNRANINDLGLPISNDLGSGFITTGAGGLNLNHEFKKETTLNMSYFYTNIYKDLEQTLDRQYIFANRSPNSYYYQADTQLSNFQNHRLQSTFRHKFNDNNSLIWRTNTSLNISDYDNEAVSRNLTSENVISNEATSLYNSSINTININTTATWRHRFKKAGRNLGVSVGFTNQNSDQDVDLLSSLLFYSPDSAVNFHQTQVQNSRSLNYNTDVTFTEPLGKRRYLSLAYRHSNYSKPLDKTFTDVLTGTIIDSLNVEYQNDYYYHQAGISFRKITDKSNLSFGVDAQVSQLDGEIVNLNAVIDQPAFYFLLPSLRWRYDFGTSHFIRLNYRTSANEPDIDQLQPVLDNSDPLNLYIGNPDLRPAYTHRMRLNYINFDQFTFSSIFANLTATYTTNDITTIRAVDRQQVQITQPTNVDYRLTLRAFASYSTPIRAIKSRFRVEANSSMQRSYSAIANANDVNEFLEGVPEDRIITIPQTRYNTTGRIVMENRNKDIIDISGGARLTYNTTVYDGDIPSQNYITQNYFVDFFANIATHWAVRTEFDYTVYDGDAVGTRQTVPIWEASVSRYFLENRRAEVRFGVMDILNRNVGIEWTSNLNYIQEEVTNSLGRYFLLTFRYQIRKVGK